MASFLGVTNDTKYATFPWVVICGGVVGGTTHLFLKKKKLCSPLKVIIANTVVADILIVISKKYLADHSIWNNPAVTLVSLPLFCTVYGGVVIGYKIVRKTWKMLAAWHDDWKLKLKAEIRQEMQSQNAIANYRNSKRSM